MIFNINSTRGQTRFITCVARVTCLVMNNERTCRLGYYVLGFRQVYSKQPILGQNPGVVYFRIVVYFPWHSHQINGTDGCWWLLRKTMSTWGKGIAKVPKRLYRDSNPGPLGRKSWSLTTGPTRPTRGNANTNKSRDLSKEMT